MEIFLLILLIIVACVATSLYSYAKNTSNQLKDIELNFNDVSAQLADEQQKNKTLLSQKISQSVRTGQIVEQMAPFLSQFPYDPKSCHFLGQPLDFIVFDFEQDKIVFLEIKSGNAKESMRQKKIKNMIKNGRVYYEKIRVSPEGVFMNTENNVEAIR